MFESLLKCIERKKEIDETVQQLRNNYGAPLDSFSKLEALSQEYNTRIYFSPLPFTPFKFRSKEGGNDVALPLVTPIVNNYNLAHELGHIILDTNNEAEAIYFSAALIAKKSIAFSLFTDHLVSGFTCMRFLHSFFKIYPSLEEREKKVSLELDSLCESGAPAEVLLSIFMELKEDKIISPNFSGATKAYSKIMSALHDFKSNSYK